MGRHRRWRHYDSAPAVGGCKPGDCKNGGQCVGVDAGVGVGVGVGVGGVAECRCGGAWGGPRCSQYVGHDHACLHHCSPPSFCVWRPVVDPSSPGVPHCACPAGASCSPPAAVAGADADADAAAGAAAGGGAWAGAALALAALLALVAAALYLLHRRKHGAFVHARLADNVEINNPMYLAGDDEPEPRPAPAHQNGGNHFANPVYESMYVPQQNPTEEHANLLGASAADGSSPPPERSALL